MKKAEIKKINKHIDDLIEGKIYREFRDVTLDIKPVADNLNNLRVMMFNNKCVQDRMVRDIDNNISNITHDLKTPIALISGYAECLQDGIDDKDYLSLIVKEASNMNLRVQNILDCSKEKSDKENDIAEEIFFADFFNIILSKCEKLAEEKKIKIVTRKIHNARLFMVKNDLTSLVQNILTNAIKYTKIGGEITVMTKVKSREISIYIKDNGIGIKKENQERIFDKFYMVDQSRNQSVSNGIGLFIVKQLAEKYSGRIRVKSKVNKGSLFVLTLLMKPIEIKDAIKISVKIICLPYILIFKIVSYLVATIPLLLVSTFTFLYYLIIYPFVKLYMILRENIL